VSFRWDAQKLTVFKRAESRRKSDEIALLVPFFGRSSCLKTDLTAVGLLALIVARRGRDAQGHDFDCGCMQVTKTTLKQRFEQFMSVMEGVENIDALMSQCALPSRQRADYLAFNRRVIIEQKSLDVDPDYKIQKYIDEIIMTRGILSYGKFSFNKIVEQLPDGKGIKKRIYHKLTQVIDDIIAKADKQTGDTRKTFLLPHAIGIVVILNEKAQLIEPDFVCIKAFDMLRLRLPTGEIRFPQNQVIILISEAHRVLGDNRVDIIPIETIFSERGNDLPLATQCADLLRRRWAEFNNAAYIEDPNLARNVRTRDPMKIFNVVPPKSS
jgi:hypothetical protein